MENYKDYIR